MDVHLLIVHESNGKITTGCGETRFRKLADPLPKDVIAWSSGVTCPACKARDRSRPAASSVPDAHQQALTEPGRPADETSSRA